MRACSVGELVPVGDALTSLDGSVKAIRSASPQVRHHFTQADQVNQPFTAHETAPDAVIGSGGDFAP